MRKLVIGMALASSVLATPALARDGMRVFDRDLGQDRRFAGSWKQSVAPAEPSGGTTVDAAARAAINQIIVALRTAGILPET